MKDSKLQGLAWVFFALMLASTNVFGQDRVTRNRANSDHNGNCLSHISGLTEKQQKQIQEMEVNHQITMEELRTKRRSTGDAIEKSEIRTEMLKKIKAHRNSVEEVLTADQKKQLGQFHTLGNNGRNHCLAKGGKNGKRNFKGKRGHNFRGKCAANSRGYGRSVTCNYRVGADLCNQSKK